MRLFVGTSGFAYKAWRGPFYPPRLPQREWLAFYAGQLNSVEINNSFYRFPTARQIGSWAQQVPKEFRFALKVPQRITHLKRLRGIAEELRHFIAIATLLGKRLGPLLFQLPPSMGRDDARLDELLTQLPSGLKAAMEFRHPSWFDPEVFARLSRANAALVYNDASMTILTPTTDWGYLRMRRENYPEAAQRREVAEVLAQHWREAYVYFKHEEGADSPVIAGRWAKLAHSIRE